ncbi:MAG: Na/Pi cotransporter family protein [Lachnospiraceae bacterium]|nr:Na/Pi cotransporter family protein [Lachnospiraceae bacterium]
MTIKELGYIFSFIGGLGMFLYGMNIMADGLQKAAGNKMKKLLGFLTNNRLLGVLVGALVTAIIQSSSGTTVMVVGFVNAGIINLTQAVGVIMGANIGTTVTAWLVSASDWSKVLKPEFIAPLIIGIGSFIILFAKSNQKKQIGEIAAGFGFLFIGLSFMSGAIEPYSDSPIFANVFRELGSNPLLGILAGTIVTAIIQSSSASVGILQTLAINGIVNWRSAVFVTLGQNIGTCVTALLSSAGANKTAKRAAVIHLLFNVAGAVIFGVLMTVVFTVAPSFASQNISSTQISMFHTVFNITNTLLLFPFVGLLVKLSGMIVPGEDESIADETGLALKHLDARILETPSFAVDNAIKEVVHMGEITIANVKQAITLVNKAEPKQDEIEEVLKTEKVINQLEGMITEYLVKISNLSLNETQHKTINNLFYTISDIERIGDHAENLAEFADYKRTHGFVFSEEAVEDLRAMSKSVVEGFEEAIKARGTENIEHVRKVVELEDDVDMQEEELREKHINRLSQRKCKTEAGVVFLDIISNLERISDHAYNIAGYVKDERN